MNTNRANLYSPEAKAVREQEGLVLCDDCEAEVYEIHNIAPALDDDAAWDELAGFHMPDCEWIATRAHRMGHDGGRVTLMTTTSIRIETISDTDLARRLGVSVPELCAWADGGTGYNLDAIGDAIIAATGIMVDFEWSSIPDALETAGIITADERRYLEDGPSWSVFFDEDDAELVERVLESTTFEPEHGAINEVLPENGEISLADPVTKTGAERFAAALEAAGVSGVYVGQ